MDVFSRRIRELREEKQENQAGIGKRAGVSQATWSNWEKAMPLAFSNLKRVAEEYERSVDYLLGLSDEKRPPKESGLVYHEAAGIYAPATRPLTPAAESLLKVLPNVSSAHAADLVSIAHAFAERDKDAAPTQEGGAKAAELQSEPGDLEQGEDLGEDSDQRRETDAKLSRFYLNLIEAGGGPEAVDELLDALNAPGGPEVARARLLNWFRNRFPDEQ